MFGGPSGRVVTFMPQLGEGTVRLNAEGVPYRARDRQSKPVDELRIFVLGGSTVVGGRSPLTTIPGIIEADLQSGGWPRARVYNFDVVSFVSGQELSLLVLRLIDLKPDLVIAYDGGNDLFQPWFYDPRPGYPFNYMTEEEAMSALANTWGRGQDRCKLHSRQRAAGSAWNPRIVGSHLGPDRRSATRGEVEKRGVETGCGRHLCTQCHGNVSRGSG
jgi:hypothetical protein